MSAHIYPALPWRARGPEICAVQPDADGDDVVVAVVGASPGCRSSAYSTPTRRDSIAIAAHIVRACNAHKAMVEALDEMLREFGVDGHGAEFEDGECRVVDRARAALAAATGERT